MDAVAADAAKEIDGSVMEGGGQILRVSAALSCITGSAIKISKIRAGRSTPGLRPQHLSGLQLVSDLCSGSLQGASIGSTDISLTPGKIQSGNHTADTQTAGSVCLLLQVALPCAVFADASSQLCLKGGTNAEMAPQIDYTVKPVTMTERGNITKIHGRAFVAGVLPFKLAKDMSAAAVRTIRKEIKELYINIQPLQEKEKACGNGNGIISSSSWRWQRERLGFEQEPMKTGALDQNLDFLCPLSCFHDVIIVVSIVVALTLLSHLQQVS
ncbi:hypothetical protein INR49_019464 [Caranx melampygus]|nr:hypothetical protein INR49_019464 [Caranx melampygus]